MAKADRRRSGEELSLPDELDTLNCIVSLYLDFAELQAKSHQPMCMKDWIQKPDDFLNSQAKNLTHAGRISAELAKRKADMEYDKFKERIAYELSGSLHFWRIFEKNSETQSLGGYSKISNNCPKWQTFVLCGLHHQHENGHVYLFDTKSIEVMRFCTRSTMLCCDILKKTTDETPLYGGIIFQKGENWLFSPPLPRVLKKHPSSFRV